MHPAIRSGMKRVFTSSEDEAIKACYRGELDMKTLVVITSSSRTTLTNRAKQLGVFYVKKLRAPKSRYKKENKWDIVKPNGEPFILTVLTKGEDRLLTALRTHHPTRKYEEFKK